MTPKTLLWDLQISRDIHKIKRLAARHPRPWELKPESASAAWKVFEEHTHLPLYKLTSKEREIIIKMFTRQWMSGGLVKQLLKHPLWTNKLGRSALICIFLLALLSVASDLLPDLWLVWISIGTPIGLTAMAILFLIARSVRA